MCHVCHKSYCASRTLSRHLKKVHQFKWPSGHEKFRYKLEADGFYRLQTLRYESIELVEELNKDSTVVPDHVQLQIASTSTTTTTTAATTTTTNSHLISSLNIDLKDISLTDGNQSLAAVQASGNVESFASAATYVSSSASVAYFNDESHQPIFFCTQPSEIESNSSEILGYYSNIKQQYQISSEQSQSQIDSARILEFGDDNEAVVAEAAAASAAIGGASDNTFTVKFDEFDVENFLNFQLKQEQQQQQQQQIDHDTETRHDCSGVNVADTSNFILI